MEQSNVSIQKALGNILRHTRVLKNFINEGESEWNLSLIEEIKINTAIVVAIVSLIPNGAMGGAKLQVFLKLVGEGYLHTSPKDLDEYIHFDADEPFKFVYYSLTGDGLYINTVEYTEYQFSDFSELYDKHIKGREEQWLAKNS